MNEANRSEASLAKRARPWDQAFLSQWLYQLRQRPEARHAKHNAEQIIWSDYIANFIPAYSALGLAGLLSDGNPHSGEAAALLAGLSPPELRTIRALEEDSDYTFYEIATLIEHFIQNGSRWSAEERISLSPDL